MAKKKTAKKNSGPRIYKSREIEAYYSEHPNASIEDAVAALASKGIEVTPAYVRNIKWKATSGNAPKTGRKGKPGRKPKAKPADTSPVEDVKHAGELMYQAVDLVMKAGYKEARSMVEMAGKMVERIRD